VSAFGCWLVLVASPSFSLPSFEAREMIERMNLHNVQTAT
jgi:hypothetical protein